MVDINFGTIYSKGNESTQSTWLRSLIPGNVGSLELPSIPPYPPARGNAFNAKLTRTNYLRLLPWNNWFYSGLG